jgi:hypothetical protein
VLTCAHYQLIGMSTFVDKLPRSIDEIGLNVVVWTACFVTGSPVSYFEIGNFVLRFVHQSVRISCAGLETCAHPGSKLSAPSVCMQ